MAAYVRRYRQTLKQNSIQSIKLLVSNNLYRENVPDHQYFFQQEKNHVATHALATSLTKQNFRLIDSRTVAYTGKDKKFTIDIANEDAYRN